MIDDFEIINEPDGSWAFLGNPQQYAEILAAADDAIHAANPSARVALGGIMTIGTGGVDWINAMLSTLGTDAPHTFDIANIHIRTPDPAQAGQVVRRWRRYLGFGDPQGPVEAFAGQATQPTQPSRLNPATTTALAPKPAG